MYSEIFQHERIVKSRVGVFLKTVALQEKFPNRIFSQKSFFSAFVCVGGDCRGAAAPAAAAAATAAITFHFLRNCLKGEPTFQSQSEFASFKKKVSEYKSFPLILMLRRR